MLVYFLSTHTWIHSYLHRADSDQDSKMSFKEIKSLLRMVNVDMNDMYAYRLFKVSSVFLLLLLLLFLDRILLGSPGCP